MPLNIPTLDDRTFEQLREEALARIPVYTPEWTNFNRSDPGVTLIELFAFMTENLLYRSNQIPERNRRKFLSLLGVPLQPASSARGIVTFTHERGERSAFTLHGGLEVRAESVSFRTEHGLDVLPVEAAVFYKRELANPPKALIDYYTQLYSAYLSPSSGGLQTLPKLYETMPLDPLARTAVNLQDAVDHMLWIALLLRPADKPYDEAAKASLRDALAGKTISLGVVPYLENASRTLEPGDTGRADAGALLQFDMPLVPSDPAVPARLPADRRPVYRLLPSRSITDIFAQPGIIEITLPANAAELRLWEDLDPLEPGVDQMPPDLEDTDKTARLITWIRVQPIKGAQARVLWMGINAATVTQRSHVANELLGQGTGEPDQSFRLAHSPVIPGTVKVTVISDAGGVSPDDWREVSDLFEAGPEAPAPDLRLPPGAKTTPNPRVSVFVVDAESGVIRFGDGLRGKRPPLGATIQADYDLGVGLAGNVGPNMINTSPALPAGLKVVNPVRTWGGANAETVAEGEKQIVRTLKHRERLVTVEDFEAITRRTPGVEIGRVEVLPAYHPELSSEGPGDAPGTVTLMLIPKIDPTIPDAPAPSRSFINAVCSHLNPRRLVTTELVLRGPDYVPIWVSVGIEVVASYSIAQAMDNVKRAVQAFLSPMTWPLRKPILDRELMAVAGRAEGVVFVKNVFMALQTGEALLQIPMTRLQLPRVLGISVAQGDPLDIQQIRGDIAGAAGNGVVSSLFVAVPVIAEECR